MEFTIRKPVSVAKINTIRILLSCAANVNWNLQQFDVKNIFLHEDLNEVHMKIFIECEDERIQEKVFKLKKSLYELKQFQKHGLKGLEKL